MPKNPLKNFSRRKSSGNALEFAAAAEAAPTSSFRVLERSDKTPSEGDRSSRLFTDGPRPRNAKSSSVDNLTLHLNRGSAGTTHSGSSGNYDTSASSARFSSTSTLPSSLDVDGEELFPARKAAPVDDAASALPPLDPPAPTFMARAGRTLSFGLRSRNSTVSTPPPVPPPAAAFSQPASPLRTFEDDYTSRDRATTTSSYASTARPPQLESSLGDSDLTSDFGSMFDNLGKSDTEKKIEMPRVPPLTAMPRRQDSDSMFPPRDTSRNRASPSPTLLPRPPNEKRYSWSSRTSTDQLMPGTSPSMGSPYSDTFSPDIANQGRSPMAGFSAVRGYQAVPDRYASPDPAEILPSRTRDGDYFSNERPKQEGGLNGDAYERQDSTGDRAVFRSELRKPTGEHKRPKSPLSHESTIRASSPVTRLGPDNSLRQTVLKNVSREDLSMPDSPGLESHNTTPRAKKAELDLKDESLFDSSPVGPVSRAINPGKQRATNGTPTKRMTRAEFERAQSQTNIPTATHNSQRNDGVDEDSEEDPADYDEEDDEDRQIQIRTQRKRQEANMAVYRQQMKKVTGGQLTDLPSRPNMGQMSHSMSSMTIGGVPANENEEDEDVPLGILQAHGFPNKMKEPNAAANAPGVPGGNLGSGASVAGDLPPFARRLPQDPYFGSSLVNPMSRELPSMNGGGSVYGGVAPSVVPGGLVGVIAGEERAKAARRGSPNMVTGGFGPIPMPGGMNPQMGRTNSMGSLAFPQMGAVPGLPPAVSPAEQQQMATQQQLAQMMQMQTQMMQQIMALQSGQIPAGMMPAMGMDMSMMGGNPFLQPPNAGPRPMSTVSNASAAYQGRSMTMGNPPSQWDERPMQRSSTMTGTLTPAYAGSVYGMHLAPNAQQGYTPSIAPSERSNVGMPSRYRPVSTATEGMNGVDGRTKSLSSMHELAMANQYQQPQYLAAPSALTATTGNAVKSNPKSTIRVIDKPKGAPKSHQFRHSSAEDEDDEEGWAEMAKKREEIRRKRGTRANTVNSGPALSDMYHGYE